MKIFHLKEHFKQFKTASYSRLLLEQQSSSQQLLQVAIAGRSSENDIEDHHQDEADGETDGADVGVLAY